MGRKSVKFPESKIRQRIRDGYGRGQRETYRGWFTVRDFSSRGVTTRYPSSELQRVMLFFSRIELNSFLEASWEGMYDFWEQYPMEREETQDIARSLGVKHPVYFGTKNPTVMTLDGVVTAINADGTHKLVVRDCKPAWRLDHPRTAEKLAIHAEYARRRGWGYMHFTERSMSPTTSQNLLWIQGAAVLPHELPHPAGDLEMWALRLYRALLANHASQDRRVSVRDYCQRFDSDHGIGLGTSQRLIRILMLYGLVRWDIRMDRLEMLRGPVRSLSVKPTQNEGWMTNGSGRLMPQVDNEH